MSIAFIHLLPEVSESYHDWVHDHENQDRVGHGDEEEIIPLPFILLFTGYALILFIDKVLFDSHGYFHDHSHGDHKHEEHEHGDHSHHSDDSDEPKVSKSFVEVTKKI